MPGPISPISGVSGVVQQGYTAQPFADALKRHGGVSDPLHGEIGEQDKPYPWQEFAGPLSRYSPEDAILGIGPEFLTLDSGQVAQDPTGDYTPYGPGLHAGPRVRGFRQDRGPEGTADFLWQSAEAHGTRTNAAEKAKASSNPLQDRWTRFWNIVRGEDLIEPNSHQTGMSAFGVGTNDRTSNPFHKENIYGLHASHRMRRYATGSIPGNYQWMRPGGRPMHKTVAGPARPAFGEGPFSGDNPGDSFNTYGAILAASPTDYVSPPQPFTVPQTQEYVPSNEVPLW